jgi:hypothetical protein
MMKEAKRTSGGPDALYDRVAVLEVQDGACMVFDNWGIPDGWYWSPLRTQKNGDVQFSGPFESSLQACVDAMSEALHAIVLEPGIFDEAPWVAEWVKAIYKQPLPPPPH